MDQKYIWAVIDDDLGVVSVWNTDNEAIEEMMRIVEESNGIFRVGNNEDKTTFWVDVVGEFQITVQREPVGVSCGWI